MAVLAGAITVLVFIFVLRESFPALQHAGIFAFFTDSSWNPKENLFNLSPMLSATLFAALGALLIAAPLGIFTAIFCSFYAPPSISWTYRRAIELLSGIPSVVYGFWGLTVMVPWLSEKYPPGSSLLAGILILSIMILPTMALAAEASFASFPSQYLNGATALGFSRFRIITSIVLPSVRPSLLAGLILQAGRALGETMAILMVCGNIVQWPENLFSPVRTLTANMALEMAYASGNHRSALFVSGLFLILMVLICVSLAQHLESRHFRA